jgi:hypothetical protein
MFQEGVKNCSRGERTAGSEELPTNFLSIVFLNVFWQDQGLATRTIMTSQNSNNCVYIIAPVPKSARQFLQPMRPQEIGKNAFPYVISSTLEPLIFVASTVRTLLSLLRQVCNCLQLIDLDFAFTHMWNQQEREFQIPLLHAVLQSHGDGRIFLSNSHNPSYPIS